MQLIFSPFYSGNLGEFRHLAPSMLSNLGSLIHHIYLLFFFFLFQTDQKLRVCDICGAFLSVYDRYNFDLISPNKCSPFLFFLSEGNK
jgi:hypothetical protein